MKGRARYFLLAALFAGIAATTAISFFCSFRLFQGMDFIVVARCAKPIY